MVNMWLSSWAGTWIGVPPGGCAAYNTYVTEPLFREIDHTADIGIEVEGASAHELFRRAGLALFSLMVNLEQVESRQERRRDVYAENWADLLHDWLSRLLSDFLQEGFIAREIMIDELSPTHLRARLVGQTLDYDRHEFELAHQFETLVIAEDVAHGKPAPDVFLQAARAVDVPPERCLALEDAPSGIQAAKAAGMRCVAIPHQYTRGLDLSGADWILSSLADVRTILDEIGTP